MDREQIQDEINKMQKKPLWTSCPKCGCRNERDAIKCWWCYYTLKHHYDGDD